MDSSAIISWFLLPHIQYVLTCQFTDLFCAVAVKRQSSHETSYPLRQKIKSHHVKKIVKFDSNRGVEKYDFFSK